jgi:4-hydroxy-tetrahydrodipicolinate synthase
MSVSWINAHNAFAGIWPALLTPLDAELNIDHARMAAHARDLLARGCGGVTIFGTTGEGPSFSMAERRETLQQLVAHGVPAERIIVSTSCAAWPETLALTRHAIERGVHGCLALPPFFFKGVSDAGVMAYYVRLLDALPSSGWRLYLYHIPQVVGVGLSQDVIRALLDRYPKVIAGIKDSACERAHSVGLARAFMPGITVYVGYEPDLPTMGALGSTGAISGLANFLPDTVRRLVQAHDGPGIAQDAQTIARVLQTLEPHALMPALKSIMATVSGDEAWLRVRPPLVAMTAPAHTELKAAWQALHIAPATA